MHMKSTTNPDSGSKGDIPVVIFSYGEDRRFLRVSEDYEDTLKRVIQAFDVDDMISFKTSSIDVCKGRDIEIDSSAYPLLWNLLEEVEIVPVKRKNAQARGHERPQGHSSPIILDSNDPKWVDDGRQEKLSTDFSKTNPANAAATSSRLQRVHEEPMKSPEVQLEDVEEAGNQSYSDEVHEQPDLEDSEPKAELFFVESHTRIGAQDDKPSPRKIGQGSSSRASPKAEKTEFDPHVNLERVVQREQPSEDETFKRKGKSPYKPQAASVEEDPRFEIAIMGPNPEHFAQFKTRGKHPVRKVLAAACKTFNVNYERAHLVHSMSIEGEDGNSEIHDFECPRDETMSQCGVDSVSKLFVRVDDIEVDSEEE
ncbi:hypothetical protein B0H34DRAFT_796368 [Crassisporium funariophilum]|nr:hypothetical protein B0H34DRAFT_796368 [Crassisporium funariophilum]